jgi:serine protease AprX
VYPNQREEIAMTVYPNPAQNVINVGFYVNVAKNVEITIFDMNGKERLRKIKHCNAAGSFVETINIAGLASGSYIVRVDNQARNLVVN